MRRLDLVGRSTEGDIVGWAFRIDQKGFCDPSCVLGSANLCTESIDIDLRFSSLSRSHDRDVGKDRCRPPTRFYFPPPLQTRVLSSLEQLAVIVMLRAFPKVYNARNIPAWNLAISSTFGFGQRSISTNSAINRSLRKSQYGSGRAEQRSPLRQSDGRGRIQPRARPLFARTPDRGSQEESMAPMRMRSSSTSIGLSRPQKKARHAPSMRHEGGRGGFSEDRGDYRKASMRSTRTNAKEHIPRSRIDSTNRSFRDHGLKESKYDYSPKLEGNRAARRAAQFGNKQDQPDSDPSMFQATRRAAIFGSNKDSPRKYQPEDTEQRAISNKFERTKRKDSVMPEDLQSDRDPPRRQWNSTAGSNEGGYERSKRSTNRTDDHYGHNEPRYGDRPSRSYEDDAPMTMPYTTPASEFLYGTSVVSAALRSGRRKLYKLYIYNGAQREGRNQDEKLEKLARQREVAIEKVQANWLSVMDRMSTGRPHNVRFFAIQIPFPDESSH